VLDLVETQWLHDGDHFDNGVATEDDEQYILPISPASITALVALSLANTVLAWDPTNRTTHSAERHRHDAVDGTALISRSVRALPVDRCGRRYVDG